MQEKCRDCRFFAKNALAPNGDGQCRYRAPKLIILGTPQGLMEMSGWPPVAQDRWCRKFERKPLEPTFAEMDRGS
jgi:hypothetical protein